ncbi:hypothetical protein AGMMS49525_14150 [Bacteroidia bacterium]|nr:hypothetical protein AGMMS49525_14150 [Bacteroidia bacterium]
MTKNLRCFGLLGLVALSSSCATDLYQSSPLQSSSPEISFKTFADKQLRASVTTTGTMTSFTTSAWSHPAGTAYDGYVLNGVTVTRGEAGVGSTWDYFPKASWPAKDSVDFFAYSPASSVNVTAGLKKNVTTVPTPPVAGPEIEYTVPGWVGGSRPVDQQEDFMVTKSVDLAFDPLNPSVQLNFKHALSRIVFKAQNQNQNKKYVIKELALSNLKSKGTLNMLDSVPNAGATFAHTPGAYDVSWKAQHDSVTYKVDLGSTNVLVPYGTGTASSDYTAITNASNGLMVLPQETVLGAFTGSTPEYGTVAEIAASPEDASYLYATVAEVDYLTNKTVNTRQVVFRLHDPANKAQGIVFEAGRQYTFLLTLGLDGEEIVFSIPSVADFNPLAEVEVPPIVVPPVAPPSSSAVGSLYPSATSPRGVVLTDDGTGHGTAIIPLVLTAKTASGTPITWASSTESARDYAIRAYAANGYSWTGDTYPIFEQVGNYYGDPNPTTWPGHAFADWDDLALLSTASRVEAAGDDKILHLNVSLLETTILSPLYTLIDGWGVADDAGGKAFIFPWGDVAVTVDSAPIDGDAMDLTHSWGAGGAAVAGILGNIGYWMLTQERSAFNANSDNVILLIEVF